MPYIEKWHYVRAVEAPATPGELNYAITVRMIARLRGELTFQEFEASLRVKVTEYLDRVGMSYTNGNAVMGVLDCAARELRRRIEAGGYNHNIIRPTISKVERQLALERKWVYDTLLAPYEDKKIAKNGDVYPEALFDGAER